MEIFSNREIAAIIWIVIALTFFIFKANEKVNLSTIKPVWQAFWVWKIQAVLLVVLIYVSLMVYCLTWAGLWDLTQLKNTVIWTVSVAIMSVFKTVGRSENKFFKHSVLDSFKLVAILEFIIGFYSFSLIIELVLVPVIFVLILVSTFLKPDQEHVQALKLIDGILIFIGALIVINAIYMLLSNIDTFAQTQTLYDFLIPPLLSLLFVPFLFILILYETYKRVMSRMKFSIEDVRHSLVAKFLILIVFNVRLELLERWVSNVHLLPMNSYKDVWNSVFKIFQLRAAEKNPHSVDIQDGWSPYNAKDILISEGIETGYYHESCGEWCAYSPFFEMGEGLLVNNIAYYVDGDEMCAKSLKLKLNVNVPENAESAHQKLLSTGQKLYEFATGSPMPQWLEIALMNGRPIERIFKNYKISVIKEDFLNQTLGGYDIKFIISNHL